jgi:hypothetical protein
MINVHFITVTLTTVIEINILETSYKYNYSFIQNIVSEKCWPTKEMYGLSFLT